MTLKRLLATGLLVVGLAIFAVVLYFAGDHDEQYLGTVPTVEHSR